MARRARTRYHADMATLLNSGPSREVRRQNAEIIHKQKLFGGRMTAQEAWAKYAFPAGAKCLGCGRPPTVSITCFVPVDEMPRIDPMWDMWPPQDRERLTVDFDFSGGRGVASKYVRWREVWACEHCRPKAEKGAATLPSWVVVEIKRGPQADRAVVAPHSAPLAAEPEVALPSARVPGVDDPGPLPAPEGDGKVVLS